MGLQKLEKDISDGLTKFPSRQDLIDAKEKLRTEMNSMKTELESKNFDILGQIHARVDKDNMDKEQTLNNALEKISLQIKEVDDRVKEVKEEQDIDFTKLSRENEKVNSKIDIVK